MSTAALPFTLEHVAEDELAELSAAIGATLAQPLDDAGIDAAVSNYLRELAEGDANEERQIAAFKLEIAAMTERYDRIRAPWKARRPLLENAVKSLCDRATFPGKAKSRTVGYGRFGTRTKPERVSVVDQDRAVKSLLISGGASAVEERAELIVVAKKASVIVMQHLKATGEVLDGFEHIPESQSYVIEAIPLT